MSAKKIVITGGPGTGKSTIINELTQRGYTCMKEISREVTLAAQKEGIDQLFLSKPLLFSDLLLKGRLEQFNTSKSINTETVFFDRAIPDVLGYMDYIGDTYPEDFVEIAKANIYDVVFILKPWKAIYKSDNERYESFEQAEIIYHHLLKVYTTFNYQPINVPFGSVKERTDFVLHTLHLK